MVDYSKWDKFASELSDEEEDAKGPMVHHVEEGGRVTIGPDGATIAAHSAQSESAVAEDANTITTVATSAAKKDVLPEEYTAETHIWKQDRHSVVLFIAIPPNARGSEMAVEYSADVQMLTILHVADVVIRKELKYKIIVSEENEIDWELITRSDGSKFIQLTLNKFEYLPGSVFWWNCVFKGDEEIDVSSIAGRKKNFASGAASSGSGKPATFADNWKKAEKMFLEKLSREPHEVQEIDVDGSEEKDGETA